MGTATQMSFWERMDAISKGRLLPEQDKLPAGVVANYLGVSVKHLTELGDAGEIERYRCSRENAKTPRYRYYRQSVLDFEARRKEGAVNHSDNHGGLE